MVSSVTIRAVDATTVTFATRSAGTSGKTTDNLLRDFTVPLTQVYTAPIKGTELPVAMVPGATGPLYLSRDGWKTKTADGFGIYGADQVVFKWPDCAATPSPPLTRLSVVPGSIRIEGHVHCQASFFELELLGPDAAEAQDVLWTGGDFIDLQLTEAGARHLRVAAAGPVKVWPTRIVINGSPSIDQAVSGEVDVLDSELAGVVQHIRYTRAGAPIALSLTQDGVNAFHVTPQAVAEAGQGPDASSAELGHGATSRAPGHAQARD
jgi:hypothetical protein